MENPICQETRFGPCYKIDEQGFELHVVNEDWFNEYVQSLGEATVVTGHHFKFASVQDAPKVKLIFADVERPTRNEMDQDLAFRRRRDVAALLERYLGNADRIDDRMRRVKLPSLVHILSCMQILRTDSVADVLRNCAMNTQRRFDARIETLLSGDGHVWRDVNPNPTSSWYSHIELFGRIFAEQIQIIEGEIRGDGRELLIVDLGCGRGHGILSISRYFAKRGVNVRFVGIDISRSDLDICHDIASSDERLKVELIQDDVSSKGFADRLRRLKPDVVLANHILEHLWAEDLTGSELKPLDVLKNRYLHNWLFAARKALSISVPYDGLDESISDHVRQFTEADVEELGNSMPLRCSLAVKPLRLEATKHGGLCSWIRERQTAFAGPYIHLTPRHMVQPSNQAVKLDPTLREDFTQPFNPNRFGQSRTAAKIGTINRKDAFVAAGFPHQARQILIKMPGTDVRLPNEFASCEEAVQLIVDHNKAFNPEYAKSYAYFNLFRGMTTFSAYRGLSLSPHGDQLQTLITGYGYPPDWSYIVSSCVPTILFEHGFDVTTAVERAGAGERVNLYDEFARQLNWGCARRTENYSIYLLSPYVVHSASEAEQSVFRVFVKVAFSTKRFFDNRELRRNMAFDDGGWLEHATLTFADGFFSHAHWNEAYLIEDVLPSTESITPIRQGLSYSER